jgi:hypothetical protein
LRMLPWPCAIVRESVTAEANTESPDGGFAYRSTLPTTCIRVLDINGDKANAKRKEGSTLYHAIPSSIILRHVSMPLCEDNTKYPDPTGWDPILVEAIVTRLASKTCHVISGKYDIAQAIVQEYMIALAAGKNIIISESDADVEDVMAFWTDLNYIMAKPRNEASE